jgi:tRNA A-37 threonylcarbamoyl transferase component Bud32
MAKNGAAGNGRTIAAFGFPPGRVLAGKYEVISRLGVGWEGEVYLVTERATGIEKAAKFFYPQRNVANRTLRFYAKKLHKLRHCGIVIHYHAQEQIRWRGAPIDFLVSEFVEGERLTEFIRRQPRKRLGAFQAIHLLHALASGIDVIHRMGEYHGDLHSDNVIVQRVGLGFELKLVDLFHWKAPKRENIQYDVFDMIRLFYDALGGKAHYARQPAAVKAICCGLKEEVPDGRRAQDLPGEHGVVVTVRR